jgi:hypothetical protein
LKARASAADHGNPQSLLGTEAFLGMHALNHLKRLWRKNHARHASRRRLMGRLALVLMLKFTSHLKSSALGSAIALR